MHPAHHEAALSAFFRRHDFHLPPGHESAFLRMGAVLTMARLLRENGFRFTTRGPAYAFRIGPTRFQPDELQLGGLATYVANQIEDIEAGRAPDWNGAMLDRMALLLRRAAQAGMPADADYLAASGIPERLIAESAIEAAHLAEAMALAEHAYTQHRKARETAGGTMQSEAA